jgi:hypothetical protein
MAGLGLNDYAVEKEYSFINGVSDRSELLFRANASKFPVIAGDIGNQALRVYAFA